MLGLLGFENIRGRRYRIEKHYAEPLGVPSAHITVKIPGRASPRRTEKAAEELQEILRGERVSELLFEKDFPMRDALLGLGLREAGCGHLLAAMSGQIAAAFTLGHERALICTCGAGRLVLRATRVLAESFRYVCVISPDGAYAALAESLERMGVTAERGGAAPEADAAIFLSPPVRPVYLPARCRVHRVCMPTPLIAGGKLIDRIGFTLPERYRGTVPPGFTPVPILSAAMEWGRITPEEVKIHCLT